MFALILGACLIGAASQHMPRNTTGWSWSHYTTLLSSLFTASPTIVSLAFYAGFVVNFPHFAFSYMLFYGRFVACLKNPDATRVMKARFVMAGLGVPLILLGLFVWAFISNDQIFLGYCVHIMFISVVWHYLKQGYGVLITASVYKRIFYSAWEKRALYFNSYAGFFYLYASTAGAYAKGSDYYGLHLPVLFTVPDAILGGLKYIFILSTCGALAALAHRAIVGRQMPSVTGVLGYVLSIYLWQSGAAYIIPALGYVVPFFHSLQYLPFVYKFKQSEINAHIAARPEQPHPTRRRWIAMGMFGYMGMVLGGVFMYFLPEHLDKAAIGSVHPHFFIISFLVFINVHHYFIDHVFWRRENADAQAYLFRA